MSKAIVQRDRALAGIVAGIVLLVAASVVVVLSQPEPEYRPENSPEAVVHNYLLALREADYGRAYSYLAPSLVAYPSDAADFAQEIGRATGMWSLDQNVAFDVTTRTATSHRAFVQVVATDFGDGWPLGEAPRKTAFEMTLHRDTAARC